MSIRSRPGASTNASAPYAVGGTVYGTVPVDPPTPALSNKMISRCTGEGIHQREVPVVEVPAVVREGDERRSRAVGLAEPAVGEGGAAGGLRGTVGRGEAGLVWRDDMRHGGAPGSGSGCSTTVPRGAANCARAARSPAWLASQTARARSGRRFAMPEVKPSTPTPSSVISRSTENGVAAIERDRSREKADRGRGLLIGEDFDVGQAGSRSPNRSRSIGPQLDPRRQATATPGRRNPRISRGF
jgi:hypothetical protein